MQGQPSDCGEDIVLEAGDDVLRMDGRPPGLLQGVPGPSQLLEGLDRRRSRRDFAFALLRRRIATVLDPPAGFAAQIAGFAKRISGYWPNTSRFSMPETRYLNRQDLAPFAVMYGYRPAESASL